MGDQSLTALYSRHQVRANALDRMLHLFSDLSTPARAFAEVLDIVGEAVPCQASSLLLITGEDGTMSFVAATGPVADKILGLKLPPGKGIAGACANDRHVISVSDVQKDPRFARELSESLGFETCSLLAVPVIHRGDLCGVLEIVNKKGSDDFPRHEVELVERLARATGALVNLMGDRE